MGGNDRSVAGKAKVLRESPTGKALLIAVGGKEYWIPQSCIHDDSEVYRLGDEGLLILKAWFAEKEGI